MRKILKWLGIGFLGLIIFSIIFGWGADYQRKQDLYEGKSANEWANKYSEEYMQNHPLDWTQDHSVNNHYPAPTFPSYDCYSYGINNQFSTCTPN